MIKFAWAYLNAWAYFVAHLPYIMIAFAARLEKLEESSSKPATRKRKEKKQ